MISVENLENPENSVDFLKMALQVSEWRSPSEIIRSSGSDNPMIKSSEIVFSGKGGLDMRLKQLAQDQISRVPQYKGVTYKVGVDFLTNQPIYKRMSYANDNRVLNIKKYTDVFVNLVEHAKEFRDSVLLTLDQEGYISLLNESEVEN